MTKSNFRPLSDDEVRQLIHQGCSSEQWATVYVSEGFRTDRVHYSRFSGTVYLGLNNSTLRDHAGVEVPSGIYRSTIIDCTIGDNARIASVGIHLAFYDIGENVRIENIGTMEVSPHARFGNGVKVDVLNEGGGREVILFSDLDAQFAHMMCLHRYRSKLIEALSAIADKAAASVVSDRGNVGKGACIISTIKISDVNIGEYATVDGAAKLVNGTILSTSECPTTVGAGVQAEDFIIGEASIVDGGAIISKTFIGQGCRIGKQFSAEGSLFFANCEGFHGEACSIFAGPYTVTHHKSTLLIAGLYSFYNAGSGTNQSNHMYKLGPIHEGKLERGSKTGSFSYLMWPCRVGPFSVVLGKHTRTFDTSDFPFSHIEAMPDGRCMMIPGFNLNTVGTVRDEAKWPSRDRRKGVNKRDRICFDVFNPLTVGRMLTGSARLKQLQTETPRTVDTVTLSGAEIKRVLLRRGQRYYHAGIHMYLLEKLITQIERAINDNTPIASVLPTASDAVFCEDWIDLGGHLMPRYRLENLHTKIERGEIADLAGIQEELDTILGFYQKDEWAWIQWAFEQVYGEVLDTAGLAEIVQYAEEWVNIRTKFIQAILLDASKEFDANTRTGFGQDGTTDDIDTDFQAVRGSFDDNPFVQQMRRELELIVERVERLKEHLSM